MQAAKMSYHTTLHDLELMEYYELHFAVLPHAFRLPRVLEDQRTLLQQSL